MSQSESSLQKFEMTEEILNSFHTNKIIPVNFFNKDGQILIPQKDNASVDDIRRLQKFEKQGIYYRKEDLDKITGIDTKKITSVNGQAVSFTKLVNSELTKGLAQDTNDFFNELKSSPLNSNKIGKVSQVLESISSDFAKSEDMDKGLVNIIEVMSSLNISVNAEMVTKRTIVAMALKIRGMNALNKQEEEKNKKEQIDIMLATYLCDIGMNSIQVSNSKGLLPEEYAKVKNHPLLSYLMVANISSISSKVKYTILNHHRPYRGEGYNNNYPETKTIISRLLQYRQKYAQDLSKATLVHDIAYQVKQLTSQVAAYDEDSNIIAIASEFASLTTKQDWRDAFTPVNALKMILNNSYFAYNEKIIHDLFDKIGLSLCNNQSVINLRDYVVAVYQDSNKKTHFEICIVESINKEQTRPVLIRVGTIDPVLKNEGKYVLEGFDLGSLRIDKRKAKYNLMANDPRRLIYVIDRELNPELFKKVNSEIGKYHPDLMLPETEEDL